MPTNSPCIHQCHNLQQSHEQRTKLIVGQTFKPCINCTSNAAWFNHQHDNQQPIQNQQQHTIAANTSITCTILQIALQCPTTSINNKNSIQQQGKYQCTSFQNKCKNTPNFTHSPSYFSIMVKIHNNPKQTKNTSKGTRTIYFS